MGIIIESHSHITESQETMAGMVIEVLSTSEELRTSDHRLAGGPGLSAAVRRRLEQGKCSDLLFS
jgi:hypothetical protein